MITLISDGEAKEVTEEQVEQALLASDRHFQEKLGVMHGLPLGVGYHAIRTGSVKLAAMVKTYAAVMREENAGKLGPEDALYFEPSKSSRRQREVIIEVEDDDGGNYEIHRRWRISRQWRGQFGMAEIQRCGQTDQWKYRLNFVPEDPVKTRLRMITKSIEMRGMFTLQGAEERAKSRLRPLLSDLEWRSYLMTGAVYEQSKRSNTVYLLRQDRPTIAFSVFQEDDGEFKLSPLCALCLHPLAHYNGTWVGVMPASDEIHDMLVMIRADEHFLWRKANQHPLNEVLSGL